MSLKDGDDTRWSSNSCDEWDLEENETRLYSMVYHNSNTYDDEEPTPIQYSGLTSSTNSNQNSRNKTDLTDSVPCDVTDVQSSIVTNSIQETLHHSLRSKVSRLEQVNEIINIADNKQCRFDKVPAGSSRNRNNRNMCSKRQANNTEMPKTASLYFQNLKKTLNNVQYFQSVDPLLSKPFDPTKGTSPSGSRSLSNRHAAVNSFQPPNRSALSSFTFTQPCNTSSVDVPLFRLDDRLFPDVPIPVIRNASKEEFELSTRLFSNKPNVEPKPTSAERDRHNHLFNQLPTIPICRSIPSIAITKSPKGTRRNRKKHMLRALAHVNHTCDANSPSPPSVEILPSSRLPRTDADIVVPQIITKPNSILQQVGTNPVSVNDEPVEIIPKRHRKKHMLRALALANVNRTCDANSPPPPSVEILPSSYLPRTDADIVVPQIITKLNSILQQVGTNPVSLNDEPVEIIPTANMVLKDSKEIINLDFSSKEVIDLDSDSADSILVITPPSRTPPPIISLSDDEAAAENTLHPLLETEHVENSFDFLDSLDEPDVLRRSQVSVFTNLISNSGSKESLLDDRLFQRISEYSVDISRSATAAPKPTSNTEPHTMPLLIKQDIASSVNPAVQHVDQAARVGSLPHPSVVITMPVLVKQPVALIFESQVRQKETTFKGDNLDISTIVNIDDDSSQSDGSVESVSNPDGDSAQVSSKLAVTNSNLIINVQDKSCIDLEINNFVMDNSENFQEVPLAPHELESPDAGRKRKRDQCDEKGGTPSLTGTKSARTRRRSKKARGKSRHQLQDFLQNRTGMMSLMYTRVEGTDTIQLDEVRPRYPTKWTREMRHFYTDSWGGENFDTGAVQQAMPADQSLWRISWEDRRGPVPLQGPFRRARCFNCSSFGHPATLCPEPRRITKCHMCGEEGHKEPSCPNKICLQCGRPCGKYSNGCWECRHVSHPLCTKCIWKHDAKLPCMDVRRNVIPPGGVAEPEAPSDLRFQLENKRSRLGQHSLDCGQSDPHHSQYRHAESKWVKQTVDSGGASVYHRIGKSPDTQHFRHHSSRRSRP